MASGQEKTFDHGCIPAHDVRADIEASIILLKAKAGVGNHDVQV
jgi:hypothetical protein